MNLNALHTFVTIAKTKNITLAAEKLHVTQPAISKRLQSLEMSLGMKLMNRMGKHLELTAAGELLLPKAKHILDIANQTQSALSHLCEDITGTLTLATSHHVGLHRLPNVLKSFTQRFPQIELDMQFVDSEIAYQKILGGEVDAAVVTLASKVYDNIQTDVLWSDPLQWVVSIEHPLTQLENIQLIDLLKFPAILPSPNTFTHDLIVSHFKNVGLTPKVAMHTNFMETIKMMVSIGLAWSVIPKILVDKTLYNLKLPITIERQLGVIHHKQRALSKASHLFLQHIKDFSEN